MKKKSFKRIFSAALAMMLTAVFGLGNVCGAMSYKTDGIEVSQEGSSAVVSVELTEIEGMSGSVNLIAVSQSATDGKISSVVTDTEEVGENESISLSAEINVASGDELKYYLIDANGGSLMNLAPSEVSGFRVIPKVNSVGVEWEAAADDMGDVEYIVYKDGAEYMRTKNTSIRFTDAREGGNYSFSVRPVDSMGLSGGTTPAQSAGLYSPSYYDFGGEGSNGVTFYASSNGNQDAFSVEAEMAGSKCRRTAAGNETAIGYNKTYPSFLYFTADRSNVTSETGDVAVVVEYYDDTSGGLSMTYAAENGTLKSATIVGAFSGTQTWKTASVIINDAEFTAPTNLTNSDFRLGGGNGGRLYVRKVYVMPAENYDEPEKTQIFIASDSIAAIYSSGQTVGWGMKFAKYIGEDASLVNLAVAGSSTKTFPNWDTLISQLNAGDYVILCFGHNDSMSDSRGVPVPEYKVNLENYINEVRALGATPIILTSIPQYNTSNYMVYDTGEALMAYRDAALEVAEATNTPSYDAAKAMYDEFTRVFGESPSKAKEIYMGMYVDEGWPNRTHLTDSGAELLARLIAEGLYNNDMLSDLREHLVIE